MAFLEALALSSIVYFGVHGLAKMCYDCLVQLHPWNNNTGDAFQSWYATPDLEDGYSIVTLHHTRVMDIVAPIVEISLRQRPMTRSLARAIASHQESICAICLEDLKDCQAIREISVCSHRYCSACIQTWLAKNRTCPLCNRDAFRLIRDSIDSE